MDKKFEGVDAVVGAVGSEGELRSSTLSTAQDDRSVAPLAPGQRWSLARKRDVVLRLMQGAPVEALSSWLGVAVYRLEEWRQRGLAGILHRMWVDTTEFGYGKQPVSGAAA